MSPGNIVLEVGCGSGAVLSDFQGYKKINLFGIDIDFSILNIAHGVAPQANVINGDGYQLPIKNKCCDITYCHYLLLWLKNPVQVLGEMMCITKRGGTVIAMAESDYGGRIDFPSALIARYKQE